MARLCGLCTWDSTRPGGEPIVLGVEESPIRHLPGIAFRRRRSTARPSPATTTPRPVRKFVVQSPRAYHLSWPPGTVLPTVFAGWLRARRVGQSPSCASCDESMERNRRNRADDACVRRPSVLHLAFTQPWSTPSLPLREPLPVTQAGFPSLVVLRLQAVSRNGTVRSALGGMTCRAERRCPLR